MKQLINFLIFSLVVLFFCSCKITAIQPSVPVKPIPYFPAEISQINVNINADLTKYIDDADHSVPSQFTGGENPCQGLRYSYDVVREPLSFIGSGNIISLGLKVKINSLKATYCAKCGRTLGMGDLHCIVFKVSGSCGAGDGDPGFDIAYKSAISFLPTYQVSTLTSLQTFNTIGSCPVTIIRYNALPTIQSKLNGTMVGLGQKVDEKISALNYRLQLAQIWTQLNKEIAIDSMGFININPKQLRLSNINMTGKNLTVSLGLSCLPVINTISNQSPNVPLPELSVCKLGDGFSILTDLVLDYTTLSSNLNSQVQGKEIKIGKKKFIFTKGEVYGGGNSKIIIELSFRGARKGTIFFTGTPVYDNITHKLSVTDLDFDLKTRSLLLRVAAWILNVQITNQLRSAAQYDLTNTLATAKSSIETNLSKKFSTNVTSICHISDVNIVGIFPTYDNLIIRPSLKGDFSVDVK